MNALRVLASPRIWLTVIGVAAVLALIFVAYLAAEQAPRRTSTTCP